VAVNTETELRSLRALINSLIGYLAGKALHAHVGGNQENALVRRARAT
jgi:hypothetical protein